MLARYRVSLPLCAEKQKKRAARQRAAKERVEQEQLMAMLAEARALIDKAEYPAEPSERERFFMEMIAAGEAAYQRGSSGRGCGES